MPKPMRAWPEEAREGGRRILRGVARAGRGPVLRLGSDGSEPIEIRSTPPAPPYDPPGEPPDGPEGPAAE